MELETFAHTHLKSAFSIITAEEQAFIRAYTGEVSDFVNYYLRYHQIPPQRLNGLICAFSVNELPTFDAYLSQVLKKLPSFDGVSERQRLYRGAHIPKTQNITKQNIYSDKGYLSTSFNKSSALRFLAMNPTQPNVDNVLFVINKHCSGREILKYTQDGTGREREVLFLPNTSFDIVNIKNVKQGNFFYLKVTMNEICPTDKTLDELFSELEPNF